MFGMFSIWATEERLSFAEAMEYRSRSIIEGVARVKFGPVILMACLAVAACSPKKPEGVCAPSAHNFWKGQEGVGLLTSGWSEPEPEFVWSNAAKTVLSLPNTAHGHAANLTFVVAPFLMSADQVQDVKVSVGGKQVASWRLIPGPQSVTVNLPASATNDDPIVLEFSIANPHSPKEGGVSTDDRLLGFYLKSVKADCA